MAYNIGINVIETEGKSSPAIAGAPTSVAGFILRSQRGPIEGDPVRVSNFRQFIERFGGHHKDFVSAYCIEGFFLNGGQEAYIARVAGANAKSASAELQDLTGNKLLTVTAGYRGREDVGEWGDNLYLDVEHQPIISVTVVETLNGNSPFILQGAKINTEILNLSRLGGKQPRTLTLKINNDDTKKVMIDFSTLPASSYASISEVINLINRVAGTWVVAQEEENRIKLISRTKGVSSKIDILVSSYSETLTKLGFSTSSLKAEGNDATQASLQAISPITSSINLTDKALIVSVDEDPQTITLKFKEILNSTTLLAATASAIAEAINNSQQKLIVEINLVTGDDNQQQLVIKSKTSGSKSKVDISKTENDTLKLLGFTDNTKFTAQGQDAQHASLSSTPITQSPIDMSVKEGPKPTLYVEVDGKLVTFEFPNSTSVTVADVASAINTQATQAKVGLTASPQTGNIIQLTTKSTGATSTIKIIVDDTLTLLCLDLDSRTSIDGKSNGTPYSEVQVDPFKKDILEKLKPGDTVCLDDGITQDWLNFKGLRPDRDEIGGKEQLFVMFDGSCANEYQINKTQLYTGEYKLTVYRKSDSDSKYQLLESWEYLGLNQSSIERINKSSSYIYIPEKPDKNGIPVVSQKTQLTNGTADDNALNTTAYSKAHAKFDTTPIQLLAVLEDGDTEFLKAVTKDAITYCEGETTKGDCMFVGHTPKDQSLDQAKELGNSLQGSKVYGALYWPWIQVTDPIGEGSNPTRWVPTTGHVMGVYARIDQTRGIWKAPAGNEAVLRGALAVEQNITDADHTYLVKEGSVNGIRMIRGAGIVIDASRTLSTDSRWLYVNIRLLFNYVKASLREELRWVKQEPNREALWNTIKFSTVTPFLQRLYHSGAFGPGLSKDVFTVVCGPENNPPDRIQVGELKVEVYFYPSRPAETIIIVIGQQDSGATATER